MKPISGRLDFDAGLLCFVPVILPTSGIDPPWSLNTGQWQWRNQLAASLPQRGFGLSFFFSFALA
jgi:hypothetical protein